MSYAKHHKGCGSDYPKQILRRSRRIKKSSAARRLRIALRKALRSVRSAAPGAQDTEQV